jgi:hypothetical protein
MAPVLTSLYGVLTLLGVSVMLQVVTGCHSAAPAGGVCARLVCRPAPGRQCRLTSAGAVAPLQPGKRGGIVEGPDAPFAAQALPPAAAGATAAIETATGTLLACAWAQEVGMWDGVPPSRPVRITMHLCASHPHAPCCNGSATYCAPPAL